MALLTKNEPMRIVKNMMILKKNNHPLLVTLGMNPQKIKTTEDKVMGILNIYVSISANLKIRKIRGMVMLTKNKLSIGAKIIGLNLITLDKMVNPSGNFHQHIF